MKKAFFVFLLFVCQLLLISPVSAHFVKSNNGIGTVLHIDPEDDPVAGEQSMMILEFKDTAGKLDLNKCDCKVLVLKSGKEIINQSFGPASESEKLTTIIPITFPEKDIYNLKLIGKPNSGSDFSNFELNYDIRVSHDNSNAAPIAQETNWFSGHMVHLIGGFILIAFLIGALIAQRKKKVVVILLAFSLLLHSVPVKAIHASHNDSLNHESYSCCLPTAAIVPLLPTVFELPKISETSFNVDELTSASPIDLFFFIRPPPFK